VRETEAPVGASCSETPCRLRISRIVSVSWIAVALLALAAALSGAAPAPAFAWGGFAIMSLAERSFG
jgi:hypothetical protein